MKLARVRYTDGGTWFVDGPYSTINQPPVGTIVQYERDVNDELRWGGIRYDVYFPGIPGYAPMGDYPFHEYFEDLDDETS